MEKIKNVTIPVTPEIYRALRTIAAQKDMALAKWARQVLTTEVRKEQEVSTDGKKK